MLRFVASFFTSNTKPVDIATTPNTHEENSQVGNVTTTKTDEVNNSPTATAEYSDDIDIFNETIPEDEGHSEEEHSKERENSNENLTLLQSLRQQKQQELAQKVLLRRISHQAVMNYYSQDYLPLSQLQEKLEEDNLPLVLLKEKLKQRDGTSIYTTTKENIKFLLYAPSRLLKRSKPAPTNDDGDAPPKDIRDYDIWDDAIIGHLMNLIDTIGMETIQEETSEEIAKGVTMKVEKELKEIRKEIEKELKGIGKEVEKESKEQSKEVVKEAGTEPIKVVKEAGTEPIKVVKEGKTESKEVVKEVETEPKEVLEVERESKEVIKEMVKEEVKETFIYESPCASIYNFSEESAEDIIYREYEDQETTVAESFTVENNNVRKKMNRKSISMAEEIINFGETINVAESLVLSSNKSSLRNKRSSRTKTDSGYGENSISTNNSKRGSRSFGRPRSMLSLGQFFPLSSDNNFSPESNNNLNRRSSIHSKKSYENDVSRHSSIASKVSVNTTTGVIMEEPNEDVFDNTKLRNKFFTGPKRSSSAQKSSNKSLHFLRNLWKSNQNLSLAGDGDKKIAKRTYRQDDTDRQLNRLANLQQSRIEENTIGTTGVSSDSGYSNFYLSMPNGKWMVRTRTASRKITGTQYVDKEYI